MRVVRPIPRVPVPVLGESFTSYVDRLAAIHQVDLLVMLHAVGIISEERYETLNGYGVLLTEAQLEQFAVATKMTKEKVRAMLLSSYNGTALDFSKVEPGDATALRKLSTDQWVYCSGTHACPRCIQENSGAWQLSWKLPWTFVCHKHKCYLVPYCPGCDRRFNGGRRDRRLSPVFVRHVPKLGVCNNPRQLGESPTGRAATPCGHVIADIPTQPAGRDALAIQKQINEALAGRPQTVCGASVSPREFFHDLRSVCALILYCADTSDLFALSDVERASFKEFADKRNAILAERRASPVPRSGERVRAFIGPQKDPELMAAVIRQASKILAAGDRESMVDMLQPIAERCIARTSSARWMVISYFRFSERVGPAFSLCLAQRSTFDRAMGNRSLMAKEIHYTFEPRHIPQLLWESDFETQFSAFFPGVGKTYARRFCALSLVKLCGHHTWGETARFLGLPEHHSIKLANRCVGYLADMKTRQQFSRRLHTIGKLLTENSQKIDYGLRRQAFSELSDIPHEDWLKICRQAQITPGQPGRRSKYAAIWLWSYLTDGDWTMAPGLEGENMSSAREVYRAMLKGVLLHCRSALIDYGSTLLDKLNVVARRK